MVDDATSVSWAQLGEQETIWAVADTLRGWIERYGVPPALYVDWKNLYKRPATVKEQLRGEEPITQFGRMCAKLGIAIIAASSPQAKGRVERSHGTHQDRLIKKLRRKEISSYEVTNIYLEREYLPEHNRRFARAAARVENYHRRVPRRDGGLDTIFRLETERTVSADWVVRYGNRFFQLQEQSRNTPALSKVLVCEGRHGQLAIEYRGRALRFQEIPGPVRPPGDANSVSLHVPHARKKSPWKPAASHPWKRAAQPGAQRPSLARACAAPLGAPPAAPQGLRFGPNQ